MNNLTQARQYLEECPPGMRDQQWRYLHRVCHAELMTFREHQSHVSGVAFHPDGQRLASCEGNRVLVWNTTTGQVSLAIAGQKKESLLEKLAYSPDGTRLTRSSCHFRIYKPERDNEVGMWDATTGQKLSGYGWYGRFNGATISADGKVVAGITVDGVKVLDAATGADRLDLAVQRLSSSALSADGQLLALSLDTRAEGLRNNRVQIWNVATGELIQSFMAGSQFAGVPVFGPKGVHLAMDGYDHDRNIAIVKIWEVITGREVLSFHGHTRGFTALAFSPEGRYLATACHDKTVILWDAITGQERLTFRGHTHFPRCVAFSADGRRLASGGTDKTVRIWDCSPLPE